MFLFIHRGIGYCGCVTRSNVFFHSVAGTAIIMHAIISGTLCCREIISLITLPLPKLLIHFHLFPFGHFGLQELNFLFVGWCLVFFLCLNIELEKNCPDFIRLLINCP